MTRRRIPAGVPFIQCPKAVLEKSRLSQTAQLLYMHILCFVGDRNEIYPSVETLAKRLDMTTRNIRFLLLELEAAGWMTRKSRIGRTNIYTPTIDPTQCPDIAFRNRKLIEARKENNQHFRQNRHGVRQAMKTNSGGNESKLIPPGVIPPSSNQESYQDLPNKKNGKSRREPISGTVPDPKKDGHSSKEVRPDPSTSWDELSQAARVLVPSFAEVELQEWLTAMMSSLTEKIPFLKEVVGYQQGLVCVALRSIAQTLESQPTGQEWDALEIETRVYAWIESYGTDG